MASRVMGLPLTTSCGARPEPCARALFGQRMEDLELAALHQVDEDAGILNITLAVKFQVAEDSVAPGRSCGAPPSRRPA